jgi:dTDP-4-amino-4,6-dideoxygalactose transaminase
MKINIFTPPKFDKKDLDIDYLNNRTGKKWIYTSNGRSAIYHILSSLNIDKILIPIYICESVVIPIKELEIEPIFYDLDIKDLNPLLDSIKELSKKYNIKAVLVASMYGNPANMIEIEQYCKQNDIFMIDDGAQSFGAKLDNRYIGTFGDAGFFSFSAGKPTAGHMGSFFWSSKYIKIRRRNHFLTHYLKWTIFYINRVRNYHIKVLSYINIFLDKVFDLKYDNICSFEKPILGGILYANLNNIYSFREKYYIEFTDRFKKNRYFSVVNPLRGIPNHHKLILLFIDKKIAFKFINYMLENNIYASNGYKLLSQDLKYTPNAKSIQNRVVELPIEDDKDKMRYLFKKVEEFEY